MNSNGSGMGAVEFRHPTVLILLPSMKRQITPHDLSDHDQRF